MFACGVTWPSTVVPPKRAAHTKRASTRIVPLVLHLSRLHQEGKEKPESDEPRQALVVGLKETLCIPVCGGFDMKCPCSMLQQDLRTNGVWELGQAISQLARIQCRGWDRPPGPCFLVSLE